MNEILNKRLEEIYANCMSIPNTIVNIFNDFFGEHRVDMQDFISIEDFKNAISCVYIGSLISSYAPCENKKFKDFDNAELLVSEYGKELKREQIADELGMKLFKENLEKFSILVKQLA